MELCISKLENLMYPHILSRDVSDLIPAFRKTGELSGVLLLTLPVGVYKSGVDSFNFEIYKSTPKAVSFNYRNIKYQLTQRKCWNLPLKCSIFTRDLYDHLGFCEATGLSSQFYQLLAPYYRAIVGLPVKTKFDDTSRLDHNGYTFWGAKQLH
jgi:hypothetical protein